MRYLLVVVMMVVFSAFAKAQLGFCTGASSEDIFKETFGSGTTSGPPLSSMQTSYRFVNSGTQDGEYTISSNLRQLNSLHVVGDHTGDQDGKALIVNASFEPDQFFQTTINGLCGDTNYEFSAWIINLLDGSPNACAGIEIPVQVRFEIWDATDTNRLAEGVMQPRFAEDDPIWIQYGLTFTTSAGQNGCILKMINEGEGGCGNDLAIDDITFKTCGDAVELRDQNGEIASGRCGSDMAESIELSVNTQEAVFDSPEYQWQSSIDGENYDDIAGANNPVLITEMIEETTFYRIKIAEDAANLVGNECANISEAFQYTVTEVPIPIALESEVVVCEGEEGLLEVQANDGVEVAWFDQAVGGTPIVTASNSLRVSETGFYYAQNRDAATGCISDERAAIEFIIGEKPRLSGGTFLICPNEEIELNPMFTGNASYEWSSGEQSPSINVSTAGTYNVIVTNDAGCSDTATFEVREVVVPQILSIAEVDDVLTVVTNDGDFLYSFNEEPFQTSNNIEIANLLQVRIAVTDSNGCVIVRDVFNKLGIDQFFTPNGDGFNDTWTLGNIESFPDARVEIFDRYGKLVALIDADNNFWDGTINNEPLPSADYWYRIYYVNQEISGNFTLKR
ncbi:T9SS type B sorting domain-containing protein [Nonlabens ponticola]|uniref:T9SS type B sorting domain-containing protein n=1 Tax=Nonlabens ponticola TaxID=2496866 RepID=A0A3S9MYX0_9FLAO|nr:T9SS type B sorting domain-containing protein [Nonlabens ponticola]AZQ44357.1 T9SS type B sorting domain-containing protein [Nonlabens ponticola]